MVVPDFSLSPAVPEKFVWLNDTPDGPFGLRAGETPALPGFMPDSFHPNSLNSSPYSKRRLAILSFQAN